MKKIIKISLLILFIIFILGITTSNAATYTVDANTTATTMLEQLNAGNSLTGISDKIRDQNPYLLCRERHVWLYSHAQYTFEDATPIVYPADDTTNGYARAYILAAPGYTDIDGKVIPYIKSDDKFGIPNKDDERQYAWYCINGEITDGNDLYNLAIAYQNYKKSEIDVKLTEDANANTIVDGENLVYGPLQIEYSYLKAESNSKFDEWGGFNYAFFDENGNNISDKVKLCTLGDNTYTEVTSTLISSTDDSNGYYKVSTADYNKVNLYFVTSDKNITKIKIKVQANVVDYEVKLYSIVGEFYTEYDGISYCYSCWSKVVDVSAAIGNPNVYVSYSGRLYTWINTMEYLYQANYSKNYIVYGTVQVEAGNATIAGRATVYIDVLGNASTSRETALDKSRNYNGQYGSNGWYCLACGIETRYSSENAVEAHINSVHGIAEREELLYNAYVYYFSPVSGCGQVCTGGKGSWTCGTPYTKGWCDSQGLTLVETALENTSVEGELETETELAVNIEVTKVWDDASNADGSRPEDISLKVYRSTDQSNWTLLTNETDYKIEWTDKEGDSWKAIISNLLRIDENGNEYYFKVEEENISVYYEVSYTSGTYTDGKVDDTDSKAITITNTKLIDIGGYVWLDGQTGIKPPVPNNGIMDDEETRLENIVVYLYYRDPSTDTITRIAETVTDKNGHYIFEKIDMGNYYVEFEYDGIHYEDTIKPENGSSKAFENDTSRNTFNGRFKTITYKKSNDGTTLNYNYADKKSTLITNVEGSTKIASDFIMNATTTEEKYSSSVNNLNLGLVKRGTDIALSTDVHDATVRINGQGTTYTYNKEDNSIDIDQTQTSEKVTYNLNLYASDYNYRVRDYITNDGFKENDYINEEDPSGLTTGADLQVSVVYELNLQNQSIETTRINEVKYIYDEKYTFKGIVDNEYTVTDSSNAVVINLNGLELKEGETKTLYLEFLVEETDSAVSQGDFSNKAEITSYSTDEGLIDIDSQPGNFGTDNQVEDDSDTAGGLKVGVIVDEREITGKVFDQEGNNVNGVIVQLIELKTVNNKVYEYIWQETVSGTEKGLRLNGDGTALEEYSYTKADGYYEFKGFIPGDYIVRFIYGDGTTYDMTDSVIKYNGQDYKSMPDANYNAEWYNTASYSEGASVARDNEARRLETMAYSVDIDAKKGLLLKLLDNTTLNLTEKETLISIYNEWNDAYGASDITYTNIEEVNDELLDSVKELLLKKEVLSNTWMCAETSKIKIPVATEDLTNTNATTIVDGIYTINKFELQNVNLGLELRPVTQIELKKYITGFKLIAANGQTLVNAYVDVSEYLTDEYEANPLYINNKVQGVKDNVTILDTVWQYEVVPTEINTIVDGANLEFEYTLVVKNTGDTDYLTTELADKYANSSVPEYKAYLTSKASEVKATMRNGTYRTQIGNTIGSSYYVGGTGAKKVLTEVTNIRDYINNDLTFVTSGNVAVDESAPHTHRILRDDYSMQEATINTILKTTQPTGKMENDGAVVLYTVALGKNPISSTGNLNFENYIAEVMSYTNAAGRRAMTSTPGNAEIVDHEHREGKSHEIDEADTGRIQIGVATGEDIKTNYIIIIAVATGIAVVAVGTYIVKKYIMK